MRAIYRAHNVRARVRGALMSCGRAGGNVELRVNWRGEERVCTCRLAARDGFMSGSRAQRKVRVARAIRGRRPMLVQWIDTAVGAPVYLNPEYTISGRP